MEQQLTIRVKDQSGEETFFKIKKEYVRGENHGICTEKGNIV
jgi:hypothetical protein